MSEAGAVLREGLLERAAAWISGDPDPEAAAFLQALIDRGELEELEARFAGPLVFGTAGLRGLVGPGLSRMNRAVVIRATRGLGDYLVARGSRALPIVVGYDARPDSLRFAADAVGVLLAQGFSVRVFSTEVPTPLVAYAARVLGAGAGIVITASHNPPDYNGYKVYLDHGAQLVPPTDQAIARAIELVGPAKSVRRVEIATSADALTSAAEPVTAELFERYLDEIAATLPSFAPSKGLRIAYTPLHGVGGRFAVRAFDRFGFADFRVVPEQAAPDGRFPTTPFPNPEEKGSLDLGLAFAASEGAELLIANDPDADRLSAAVATPSGRFVQLSGNQIGVLLADELLRHTTATEGTPALVLASVVSSPMLGKLARAYGARFESTLTGFKWLWSAALELERERKGRFVFACEEALGYSVSPAVRDKDGISSAVLLAGIAARLRREQKTLLDRLAELYREHGLWVSVQHSVVRPGVRGNAEIEDAMQRLAASPPSALADRRVSRVRNFREPGDRPRWLGVSDLIELELEGGGRVLARPSGTEPKLKIYVDLEAPLGANDSVTHVEEEWRERALELARALEQALGFTP
jgi:phosphomannomutase